MSSVFLKSFVEKQPRENSGSRSANRFDYQKNWSLCELLALHTEKDDYLMVFEHHEDVVVLDSKTNPTSAIFYQVKSKKSGNWTIGALTTSKDSIIRKLYSNYIQFSDHVDRLVFTSNQGLSTKLANGEKGADCECITFAQLSVINKETIQQSAEGMEQMHCDIVGLSKITLIKTDLRLADHSAIAKGKLVEFFENIHPENPVHISLAYKTIFDEIRRKTNYEPACKDINELWARKSIGHTEFEGIINVVLHHRSTNELWAEAHQLLTSESYGVLRIRGMRAEWLKYVVDRMDVSDESLMEVRTSICSHIAELEASEFGGDFKCLSKQVLDLVKSDCDCKYYSDAYIESAILYEVINNDPISPISSKFKEEAK